MTAPKPIPPTVRADTWQVRIYNGPYLYDGASESDARRIYSATARKGGAVGLFRNCYLVTETPSADRAASRMGKEIR